MSKRTRKKKRSWLEKKERNQIASTFLAELAERKSKLHAQKVFAEESKLKDLTDDCAPNLPLEPQTLINEIMSSVPVTTSGPDKVPEPSTSGAQQAVKSKPGKKKRQRNQKAKNLNQFANIVQNSTASYLQWTPERLQKWTQFHEKLISDQQALATGQNKNVKFQKQKNNNPNVKTIIPNKANKQNTTNLASSPQSVGVVSGTAQEIKLNFGNQTKKTAETSTNIIMNRLTQPTVSQQQDVKNNPTTNTQSNISQSPTTSQPIWQTPVPQAQMARASEWQTQTMPTMPTWTFDSDEFGRSYPKGIPKSFLRNNPLYTEMAANLSQQNPTPTFAPTFTEAIASAGGSEQMFVQTNNPTADSGTYSPTQATGENPIADDEEEEGDGSESPTTGQKRLSAFQRLGPLSQPKKPKLTINLLFSKEHAVREVLDDEAVPSRREEHVPVHRRQDVLTSTDDTVTRYLPNWPWKNKVGIVRTAMPRSSKSSMMMEQEAMTEAYESNHVYIKIQVRDYPAHYKKEDVLDLILDNLKGKSFIPCFIEFTPEECTFLVLRNRGALTALHKMGLYIRKESENINLPMKISITDLTLTNIDFIPRLILRNRLRMVYDGEKKLDLTAFCLQSDVSHFLYFPLNNVSNQCDLLHLQSAVSWQHLIELNLSKNRLTSLEGFELASLTPRLKYLDLSYNLLDNMSTTLLPLRGLLLSSLILEGNPLCMDYVDTQHYVAVAKMIFPSLVEIDGVQIPRKGELWKIRRNFCPEESKEVVERFLEVFFPLLESPPEDRVAMEDLYHEDATFTLTFCYKLRYNPMYRYFRNMFNRARVIEEENYDSIEGAANIAKHFSRWPSLKHDPFTFYIDVLHHSESTTILRICGLLKLTSDSLAEDEHLLYFTRTLILRTSNGMQYKISNEMLNWEEPIPDCANKAFQVTTIKSKKLSLKLDTAPDEDLKEKLIAIFMKLTEMNRKKSERCLEMRNWDLRNALDYFIKLCKLNSIDTLEVPDSET